MSRFVFKLPDVGEGTAEVEIVKWHVAVGDFVEENAPLVDVMTDKATVEITAPVDGRIAALHGAEGDRAAVGSKLAEFDVEAEPDAHAPPAKTEAASGPSPPPVAQPKTAEPQSARERRKALAAPAVRARAKALEIDLATVSGSGPDGRVLHADLDRLLVAGRAKPQATAAPAASPSGSFEDIKIIGLRRRIAERMLEAKRNIPHFTYVEEVDVTDLEALRARLNERAEGSARLTPLPLIIRALIGALGRHGQVNAHFLAAENVLRKFDETHLGVATDTERGLMVPVIHNADRLDVWRLGAEIARLSEAARSGKALPEELACSTITVTSLGALGGIASTPIINPPEVAIVGVGKIVDRAIVHDSAVVVRKMMNLSSSFDHRAVDGRTAAAFIAAIKRGLEAPAILAARAKG
jgi:2-oxoisovalerate dehydrogenase E2 component (dihydrolipoyl transacylase)